MKTENLQKALRSAQSLSREIREAHTDAANSNNQFAEIAIFNLISSVTEIELKIQRLAAAASNEAK